MAFVGIVCPTVLSRMWYSTSKIGVRLVNLNAASIEVDFFYLSKPNEFKKDNSRFSISVYWPLCAVGKIVWPFH
jgi:hypothetical protein